MEEIRGGRRPKLLRPEIQEKLLEGLRSGLYMEQAARMAGIDVSTLRRYVERGKRQEVGLYRKFYEAVQAAEAEVEDEKLQQLFRVAERADHWQGYAWFLERRFPDRWGRRAAAPAATVASTQATVGGAVQTFVAAGTSAEYIAALEAARKATQRPADDDEDGGGLDA